LIAALAVAALCAPGTWLRSEVRDAPPERITITRIAPPRATVMGGWTLEGAWEAKGDGLMFGGFSALLTLGTEKLRAFSDRGVRFTLTEPDRPGGERRVEQQLVQPDRSEDLWDIESATRDPMSGDYWLGFENIHTIQRFSRASELGPLRTIDNEVDWGVNEGAEAMVRLADGRFVIVPEGPREGLVFANDPAEGAPFTTFRFEIPAYSYAATDMAQLPDGRVLLLLRNVVLGLPPFASKIAIADPPRVGQREVWKPQIALDLARMVPPENYEGMAVRSNPDGTVTVWLISDDNFSVLQRTLLVKLRFDPDWKPQARG
jgi:hypothetical protein